MNQRGALPSDYVMARPCEGSAPFGLMRNIDSITSNSIYPRPPEVDRTCCEDLTGLLSGLLYFQRQRIL